MCAQKRSSWQWSVPCCASRHPLVSRSLRPAVAVNPSSTLHDLQCATHGRGEYGASCCPRVTRQSRCSASYTPGCEACAVHGGLWLSRRLRRPAAARACTTRPRCYCERMRGPLRLWLALTITLASCENFGGTWEVKGGGDGVRHDSVTPEEVAYTKMPGRCCFDGEWVGPLGSKQWVQHAETCGACAEWGLVSSTCHASAKECVGCGVPLYCDPPPPIVASQRQCIGPSRVGVGCQDPISMGVCMNEGMEDCHEACKRTAGCQIFILYVERGVGFAPMPPPASRSRHPPQRGRPTLHAPFGRPRPSPPAFVADKRAAGLVHSLL